MLEFLAGKPPTTEGFCENTREVWQLVGTLLRVATIALIVCVIIFGVIDFGKAVVASKDDEIKKAAKQLMFRVIAVIAIFFIPTIVGSIFTLIGDDNGIKNDYDKCGKCIKSPSDC